MYSNFGQFIDGQWQQAEKKETYKVINPATEEVLGEASKASSVDVQKALKSAEKGLETWKNTTPSGTPASLQIFTSSITAPGVITSGLQITEQPAASAVEIFLDAKTIGKFHGTSAATTPTG